MKAEEILEAIGGKENVRDVEACITRLRVEINDPTKVDEEGLRASGAFGVVMQGEVVQVVVGPEADELAEEMDKLR